MDDSKFTVTFPSSKLNDEDKNDYETDEVNTRVTRRRKDVVAAGTPVVVLLGWLGGRDKHLAKYSALYESEGFITVRYPSSSLFMFSSKQNLRAISVKVLESLFDLGLQENPIFFHVFSNAGGYVYRGITEFLHGPDPGCFALQQIRGIIFDSSPSRPTMLTAYKAITSSQPTNQHWILSRIKALLMWVVFLVLSISSNSQRKTYFDVLLKDKMACPQLFLYSESDRIVKYTEIQEVIQARRRGGFEVREVVWKDTDHVAHLLKHREEYKTACILFVNDMLEVRDKEMN